jgi:hypothetical protein
VALYGKIVCLYTGLMKTVLLLNKSVVILLACLPSKKPIRAVDV